MAVALNDLHHVVVHIELPKSQNSKGAASLGNLLPVIIMLNERVIYCGCTPGSVWSIFCCCCFLRQEKCATHCIAHCRRLIEMFYETAEVHLGSDRFGSLDG